MVHNNDEFLIHLKFKYAGFLGGHPHSDMYVKYTILFTIKIWWGANFVIWWPETKLVNYRIWFHINSEVKFFDFVWIAKNCISLYSKLHRWLRSMSCHHKLSTGRLNMIALTMHKHKRKKWQWHLSVHFFKWKITFKDTIFTNRSGTQFMASRRRHTLYCGAFGTGGLQRAFIFAEKGQNDQTRNN